MPMFTPLQSQEPVPLPEADPLWSRQFGEGFSIAEVSQVRHDVVAALGDASVSQLVGCPIPREIVELAESCVDELIGNAHRPAPHDPKADRRLTGVYVWGSEGELEVGVGDSQDTIAADDGRPQTEVLPPSVEDDQPADDLDTIVARLAEAGLGGSMLERMADEVCYSLVGPEDAARDEEPRTHKVIRFKLHVPPVDPTSQDRAA